jgi:hypothetical protein
MKTASWLCRIALLIPLALAGCKDSAADKGKTPGSGPKASDRSADRQSDDEIQANLAMLSPEDRKVAEAQRFCAVEEENRLGSMGKPFKVMVKEQPVFLCCKGCQRKALADPDKTLAKVRQLKARNAGAPEQ